MRLSNTFIHFLITKTKTHTWGHVRGTISSINAAWRRLYFPVLIRPKSCTGMEWLHKARSNWQCRLHFHTRSTVQKIEASGISVLARCSMMIGKSRLNFNGVPGSLKWHFERAALLIFNLFAYNHFRLLLDGKSAIIYQHSPGNAWQWVFIPTRTAVPKSRVLWPNREIHLIPNSNKWYYVAKSTLPSFSCAG